MQLAKWYTRALSRTLRWVAIAMFAFSGWSAYPQSPLSSRNDVAAQIVFQDLNGGEHYLPCQTATKALVLVFISADCPIANSYQPMLQRLRELFIDKGIDFVMVHGDGTLTLEAARKHQRDYEIAWPIVLDPGNQLARRLAAKTTPEAIVIDTQGKTLYRGRIDDRYETFGRKRPVPTSEDLQAALTSISQNHRVKVPETKAVGCVIRFAE